MINLKKIAFTLFLFVSIFQTSTNIALAETENYKLLAPLPCISTESNPCSGTNTLKTTVDLKDYVQYAFNLLIAIGGAAAVFMIVWGGFEYMTSTIPGVKTDGIGKVKNALFGLLLLLSSFLILKTVDPSLVSVPNTLLPQIRIQSNLATKQDDYVSDLIRQAARLNAAGQELIDKAKATKKTVAEIEKKIADLETEINVLNENNVPNNDPRILEIKAKIQKNYNDLQQARADITIDTAKSVMINGATVQPLNNMDQDKSRGTLTVAKIERELNKSLDFIDKEKNERIDDLREINYYDTSELESYSQFAKLTLRTEIQSVLVLNATIDKNIIENFDSYGVYQGAEKIGRVADIREKYRKDISSLESDINKLTDQKQKSDLMARIATIKSTFDSKFVKK